MSLCNRALLVLVGFAKQRRGCGVVRSDIVIELRHLFSMFSYLASRERYSYFQPWTQGSKHVTNGRENPAILSKGMFGKEWWESVLFSLCPYPQPLGWFHKGKEGGEKVCQDFSNEKHVHTDRNRLFSIKESGHGNNYIFEFIIMFIKLYSRKDYKRRFWEGIPSAQFSLGMPQEGTLAIFLMFSCWTLMGSFYNCYKLKEKVIFYFPICDIGVFYLLSSPCHLVFLWRNTRFLGSIPNSVQDLKFSLSLSYTCIHRHVQYTYHVWHPMTSLK